MIILLTKGMKMKSEQIFKGVNQQIKVFDSAGDKKIFGSFKLGYCITWGRQVLKNQII